jgi:hypothetical protein
MNLGHIRLFYPAAKIEEDFRGQHQGGVIY